MFIISCYGKQSNWGTDILMTSQIPIMSVLWTWVRPVRLTDSLKGWNCAAASESEIWSDVWGKMWQDPVTYGLSTHTSRPHIQITLDRIDFSCWTVSGLHLKLRWAAKPNCSATVFPGRSIGLHKNVCPFNADEEFWSFWMLNSDVWSLVWPRSRVMRQDRKIEWSFSVC